MSVASNYRLFVRWDRVKTLVYLTLISLLSVVSVVLYWQVNQKSSVSVALKVDDQQYIATGKRFIEFLYSLNAATIVEDSHMLTRMIHEDSQDKKNEHIQYMIDKQIVKKTQAAGLRSRINWERSSYEIKQRAEGARIIEYTGIYEYKTAAMNDYQVKPFSIEIGLREDKVGEATPYGIAVYGWDNKSLKQGGAS
jgi:hypothetical protein